MQARKKDIDHKIVVKVCDINDPAKWTAAHNEAKILRKLKGCQLINQMENFYEDSIANKSYTVLEHAGDMNLFDYVNASYADPPSNLLSNSLEEQSRGLDYLTIRAIMQ